MNLKQTICLILLSFLLLGCTSPSNPTQGLTPQLPPPQKIPVIDLNFSTSSYQDFEGKTVTIKGFISPKATVCRESDPPQCDADIVLAQSFELAISRLYYPEIKEEVPFIRLVGPGYGCTNDNYRTNYLCAPLSLGDYYSITGVVRINQGTPYLEVMHAIPLSD